MIRAIYLFALLFAVWLIWSGHYIPFLLELGFGSCLLIVLLCRRMDILDPEGQPIHLHRRFPLYLVWLAKEVVLSNFDVARRILHPKLPISPTMFYVKASQESAVGQVIYANSITLTPGTITVRLRDGYLIVHAISREAADAVEKGTMDRKVTAIEGTLPE